MSTGDLENSLRAEIESYVSSRMSGLKEEVERLRAQLDEALSRISESAGEPVGSDAPVAVAVAEHLRNARNLGIEEASASSARARASSEVALIKAAVDELETRQTQADVLSSLVNRSAAFAPRVAFFVVRDGRATGWRARGLEGTVGDDSVRELSLPVSSDTVLGEVVRTRSTWSGEPGTHAEDHTIYNHFGGEPPPETPDVERPEGEDDPALLEPVLEELKTVHDPEIPVNIVDLGLVYDCKLTKKEDGSTRVDVKMTLTAPGCGMGPAIAHDAQSKILTIDGVDEADVQLVWDPPWNQNMISEAGRMKLGML